MSRWSTVRTMKINSVSQASVLQIGDNELIKPVSKVLALQRQLPEFAGNEGNFGEFDLFSRTIPLPQVQNESITMKFDHNCSRIEVGGVTVYGLAAASVLQVGSNKKIETESRIKHIRQFFSGSAEDEARSR